jgi:DNA-binding IclR family transcriptional regulator
LSAKRDPEIERLRRRINASGEGAALTRDEMMARVNAVRARGYAFSRNAISQGVGIIGAALPNGPFGRVFAVGAAGQVERLERKEEEIVAALKTMLWRLAA